MFRNPGILSEPLTLPWEVLMCSQVCKKLTRRRGFLALLICVVLVSGFAYILLAQVYGPQPPCPCLVLINNTSGPIRIISEETAVTVLPGNAGEVKYPAHDQFFAIRDKNSREFIYLWAPVSHDRFLHNYRIFLQLQPDNCIGVFPFVINKPQKNLPPQPLGYPLHPKPSR